MRRRTLLGTAGAAIAAGCLEDDEATDDTDENGNDGADNIDENGDNEAETEESVDDEDGERTEAMAFPPGTSEDGIDDPERLEAAYTDIIGETTYQYRDSFTMSEMDGGQEWSESMTLTADPEREQYRYERERDGIAEAEESAGFVDGDDSFVRQDGTVERDEFDAANAIGRPVELQPELLEGLTFEYDESRTGEQPAVHAFSAVEYDGLFDDQVDPIGDPTGDLLVDEDGLLYEFTGTLVFTNDGEEVEYDLEWSFSEVGEASVTEPDWLEDAPEPVETYDGFLDPVDDYDGPTDATGRSHVTIGVGEGRTGFRFDPIAVVVDAGTTVRWEWSDHELQHNVASVDDEFRSDLTGEPGATFEHTFEETGVYRYVCEPHETVKRGVVEVV
ncbi:hypothetical protein CV102_04545 [Natronococcus pandeyae]|uniref:Blue (type 1) copper domain-containing protein n=1 Tax=Natronococcus pandeyae TaxID=2055836 RepID=A0A8J8Q6M9_9EURY|nr:halocyanin domain-containing protein [Natronococcus pandeyae]TYL39568.1 hypothetical protein CV102_04545 [Natronococcus pandeyae]